jgi:hypothetical protein
VTTAKLLQDVSRVGASGAPTGETLAKIAELTLEAVSGTLVVSLNKSGNKSESSFATCARISAPIRAQGRNFGTIDLYFESATFADFEQLPLAKFLGEQIGLLLAGKRLGRENRRLLAEVHEMQRELELRKIVQRARGILAVAYNSTDEEAMQRIQQQSIRLGKPIVEIAESIITYQTSRFARQFKTA